MIVYADDAILFRTGFVELDAVTAGDASASIVSFTAFPLVAHLGRAAKLPRFSLPFGREKGVKAMASQLTKALIC